MHSPNIALSSIMLLSDLSFLSCHHTYLKLKYFQYFQKIIDILLDGKGGITNQAHSVKLEVKYTLMLR